MHAHWRLSHARGYLELGMIDEAAHELAQLPHGEQDVLPALALRAAVFQAQDRWPELHEVAAELVRLEPGEAGWWVTFAFATRRADSLSDAQAILREAERLHPDDPTIQFNLGCYACQLGDLPEARRRLARAIKLDARFRALAAEDPDLTPLRDA